MGWVGWAWGGGWVAGGSAIEFTCNVGATGVVDLTPRLEQSPGGGHGNPCCILQYSCLENAMDRGAWWATVHRVAKSRTQLKLLSTTHRERGVPGQTSSDDTVADSEAHSSGRGEEHQGFK